MVGHRSPAYVPRLRHVELPSATLRVAELGDADTDAGGAAAPPLLLVNGIGARLEMWRPLARRLAEGRHVVMFDAPGTGGSARLRRPLRMPGLARLVVDLLDVLGAHRVDVLGYSWGGALSQQLAHDAPDRVRRLILASTTPGLGGQLPSLSVLALMSSPLRMLSADFLARAAPVVYGGDVRRFGAPPRAQREWLAELPSQLGYAQQMFAISGWSSLPWLRRIRHRTLVIGGDDDPLAPVGNARRLAARIPDARLHVVPGGGHLWLLERASDSAALIGDFLR